MSVYLFWGRIFGHSERQEMSKNLSHFSIISRDKSGDRREERNSDSMNISRKGVSHPRSVIVSGPGTLGPKLAGFPTSSGVSCKATQSDEGLRRRVYHQIEAVWRLLIRTLCPSNEHVNNLINRPKGVCPPPTTLFKSLSACNENRSRI